MLGGVSAHPRGLATLGQATLGQAWAQCGSLTQLRKALDTALPILRTTNKTEEKLRALALIREAQRDTRGRDRLIYWRHVEFFALNSLFAWPLLTLPLNVADGLGFAFPFWVDVSFDDGSSSHPEGEAYIESDRNCQLEGFRDEFRRALKTAKDLWRSQYGYQPLSWRNAVLSASVTIAGQTAGQILAPFGLKEFPLDGRSLEGYFTVAILSRFIGMPIMPPIAATGLVGRQVMRQPTDTTQDPDAPDIESDDAAKLEQRRWLPKWLRNPSRQREISAPEPQLNFEFDVPGGVMAKIRWCHASHQFDRIILPKGFAETEAQEKVLSDYIKAAQAGGEIVACKYLGTVADAAFAGAWRRHRYVRAPDIAWLMENPRFVDDRDKGVSAVLRAMRETPSPIVHLPMAITLRDVTLTLHYLNGTWQRAQRPRPPARRSFLFFRVTSDESRSRLLFTLWRAIGGRTDRLERLVDATDAREVVGLVAEALNAQGPTSENPEINPPDVLVFILPKDMQRPGPAPNVTFRGDPHVFAGVFGDTLAHLLKPIGKKPREEVGRWPDIFGLTRILIVQDQLLDEELPKSKSPPNDFETEILRDLAIFRYGFTQNMATLAVDQRVLNGKPIRDYLLLLVRKNLLCRIYDKYFLTDSCRQRYIHVDPHYRAQAHVRAGLACAPYLPPERLPGLAEFEARLPEMVHEAEYHFEEATRISKSHGGGAVERWKWFFQQKPVRDRYIARLACSYDIKSWDFVRYASTTRGFPLVGDATRIAIELASQRKPSRMRSNDLGAALRLIERFVHDGDQSNGADRNEELAEMCSIAKRLASCAIDAMRDAFSKADRAKEAVFVGSSAAIIGMHPLLEGSVSSFQLWITNRQIWRAVSRDPTVAKSAPAEWYARYAEVHIKKRNPAHVLAIYRLGRAATPRQPPALPLWIKALGYAESGTDHERAIFEELVAFRSENLSLFARFARKAKSYDGVNDPIWQKGYEKFVSWMKRIDEPLAA